MKNPSWIRPVAATGVVAALAAFIASSCSPPGDYGAAPPYTGQNGTPGPVDCSAQLPSGNPEIIFEFVSGPHCDDSTYGDIDGYYFDTTFKHFEIIKLTASPTNSVIFQNTDGQDHWTSSLGPWTGSFPANGPSQSATPSPTGTDIGSAGWTTGLVAPGAESRAYVANIPGTYVIGDAFFYSSNNMRTVIIVQ